MILSILPHGLKVLAVPRLPLNKKFEWKKLENEDHPCLFLPFARPFVLETSLEHRRRHFEGLKPYAEAVG